MLCITKITKIVVSIKDHPFNLKGKATVWKKIFSKNILRASLNEELYCGLKIVCKSSKNSTKILYSKSNYRLIQNEWQKNVGLKIKTIDPPS